MGSNIIFLSSDDQKQFGNDFVDSLPWQSFGRKNVGYIYAIAHNAKVIWDFDDDNYLKFWLDGASPHTNLDLNSFADSDSKYLLIITNILQSSKEYQLFVTILNF